MTKKIKVNDANWIEIPEYRLNSKEIEMAFSHAAKLVKWNRTSIAMAVAASTSDPITAIEITKRLKAAF